MQNYRNPYSDNNIARFYGKIITEPTYSHTILGEDFYKFVLEVKRLSGTSDYVPVTVSKILMDDDFEVGEMINLYGQIRTYNYLGKDSKSHLSIEFFVQGSDGKVLYENDKGNYVDLTGTICKKPVYRETPFGRKITDAFIAVNRSYSTSDYIPVIAWGRTGYSLSKLNVGDKINLVGRFQSRDYQKRFPDGSVENRTAYEISTLYYKSLTTPPASEFVRSNYDETVYESDSDETSLSDFDPTPTTDDDSGIGL